MGETEDISIGGENGEIPYNPMYLTSRTIRQPNRIRDLQELEKVLLEHQSALNERKKNEVLYFTLIWKRNSGFIFLIYFLNNIGLFNILN